MHVAYYKHYSQCLNRDMEFKVYGHNGLPILHFPTQNGQYYEFGDFGMADCLNQYLENGQIQVFCCSSVDLETLSDSNGNHDHRGWVLEQWYYYITNELMPYIYQIRNDMGIIDDRKPITSGFSVGALHAMNFYLRRPDLFSGTISLSGPYSQNEFFHSYNNQFIYNNSPIDYLRNMSADHYYVNQYRNGKIIFCVGQGKWEEIPLKESYQLKEQFDRLNVNCWFDVWGYDVDHDWPWWRVMMPYFIDKILGD